MLIAYKKSFIYAKCSSPIYASYIHAATYIIDLLIFYQKCWSLFLIIITFLKRDSNKCFSMKFAKFLTTPILRNICEWILHYRQNIKRKDKRQWQTEKIKYNIQGISRLKMIASKRCECPKTCTQKWRREKENGCCLINFSSKQWASLCSV